MDFLCVSVVGVPSKMQSVFEGEVHACGGRANVTVICYLKPRIWNLWSRKGRDQQQGKTRDRHTLQLRRAVRARLAPARARSLTVLCRALRIRAYIKFAITLGRTMKKAALIFSGLLLSALACGSVSAETVRVRLTARVNDVSDPQGQLNGKIVVGQRVSGTYVYNSNTPNLSPIPGFGHYRPYANEARVRFAAGSHVFESAQPTQGMAIMINPHTNGSGQFILDSNDNKPLANGVSVNSIFLDFQGTGTLTQSEALPTAAPDLHGYWRKEVSFSGGGFAFNVRAVIEAAELIVVDAIEVSPAAGSFVTGQRFDAALTLPRNSSVTSAQASANGISLPLNYPGTCQLLPSNSAGKPTLLCPDVQAVLPSAGGAPIEWNVVLTNGTTLTQSVDWELAQ